MGPDNAVIFSAGPLGGTLASAGSRTDVMCKNPLTGLLGSGNMGGFSPRSSDGRASTISS